MVGFLEDCYENVKGAAIVATSAVAGAILIPFGMIGGDMLFDLAYGLSGKDHRPVYKTGRAFWTKVYDRYDNQIVYNKKSKEWQVKNANVKKISTPKKAKKA